VDQNYGGGIPGQCLAHHFSRMHAGPIDRAAEQLLEGDQVVTVVQVQAAEELVGLIAQPRHQIAADSGRGIEQRSDSEGLAIVAPGQFQGRLQAAISRGPEAALLQQHSGAGAKQTA